MKKIIAYVLLISWMILIYYMSAQTGSVSGNLSGGIIYNTLEFIYSMFSIDTTNIEEVVELIHVPLREMMHLFEYLILGILIYNVLNNYNFNKKVIISIMFCFIYSVFDEVHQAFVPNRTFQYIDILMDMIGYLIGIFISNKFIFKSRFK